MSLVISTNMSALNTTNQLNKNSSLMNSSLQKLSSGYSINSSADNAAGLSISEKMRAQIQGLDQASSNSQDAISLAQTADGALDETTSILKRMRELAVQASTDSLTDDDRSNIQDETDQLRQELDRISNDTEYNTKKLLNGDSGASTAVSGTNSAAIDTANTVAGNNTASGVYTVNYTSVATEATTGLATASTSGITAATSTISSSLTGSFSINGTTINIESSDTISGIMEKINDETSTTGVTATLDTTTAGNYFIKLTDSTYGSSSSITLKGSNDLLGASGLFNATSSTTATSVTTYGTNATGTINGATAVGEGNTLKAFDLTVSGDDAALTTLGGTATATANTAFDALVTAMSASTGATSASADKSAAADYNTAVAGGSATAIAKAKEALIKQAAASDDATTTTDLTAYKAATATTLATADVTVDASTALTFQVGANTHQSMSLSIGDMDANALGVAGTDSDSGIDLTTVDAASSAISVIDKAIKKVSSERSNLGAVQNSLESNINNLDTESENLTSAESNIRDTDMASEMSTYTKLSVITQAATAMLAKANQQPQQVLTLLQG
ncbi:flagellin [Azotosporobacter soli]|uniref:flagellin N-terminal helical domain-containing protein n=1 Tax=Azotosporobacter soli TaxID=3055040 RepID=UPI0031FF031A